MYEGTIQVLKLPRPLPRVVIWSIYSVTWLGLIVAIVVVVLLYNDVRQPLQSDRQKLPRHQNHSSLTNHHHDIVNWSSSKKRRQQQQQQQTSSPGFVTLEEVVAYECHFQTIYQNTTWLSDTQIIYQDEFGKTTVKNVSSEMSVRRNLRWLEDSAVRWDCRDIQLCNLDIWIFSFICRSHDHIWIPHQHLKYIISLSEHCPWLFTFIPHSSKSSRDVDLQHYAAVIERKRDAEWKELFEPSMNDDLLFGKIHVTKTILEATSGNARLFVAAPISNVSLRFVYGGEPPRCLTCPQGSAGAGLECLSSDALLSPNSAYYILYCRGPEVPWTGVMSTRENRLIYQLDNQANSREHYASRIRPIIRELEVKLDDGKHIARVRLHLPPDWTDKMKQQGKCIDRLRLLLRIADEQHDQMIDAKFDFSLTNYLTVVKRYAVVYADVRNSKFQMHDFRYLRFRRRELMQMSDYSRIIARVSTHLECIERGAIGVYGENYGGHVALNLVGDNNDQRNPNDDDKLFRCAVAVNPLARWHDYVYPFTVEHVNGVTGALRKKMFKRYYMAALINRLRGMKFAVHTSNRPTAEHRYYTSVLLKMLNYHKVEFEHRHYEDQSVKMCDSRLKSHREASDFFDRCFGREINT